MRKKLRLKGVRIQDTFEDFLENHPEIKVQCDEEGDMINVIPAQEGNGVEITSQTVINHKMMWLGFSYKGEHYSYKAN
ncbi:MAG: hypothetical protein J6M60_04295 [Clostridia bacterium]|nr:hypothetical protein [Clostridia bacterium]